jgi:hypothetical protein
MREHERYADWDGAYVLGVLPPSERAEYERHLDECFLCQDAVADLTPLPGLLARVDPDTLDSVDELPPADLERRLMAAARPAWWRRTSTRVGLGLAAAAAVAAAVVVPITVGHHAATGQVQLTLHDAVPSPLSASVALAPEQWGTRVEMTCRYAAGTGYGSRAYALYVVDDAGHRQRVSTWRSGPGDVARTTGATDLALGDITRVELTDVATNTVVLSSAAG